MDHLNKNHFWLKIELFQQHVFFGYLVKPRRVKEVWWMGSVMMDIVAWWCCSPICSTISISTSRRSWRLDVPTCCNARTSGPEWPTDGPTRRPSTSSSKILIRPHKTSKVALSWHEKASNLTRTFSRSADNFQKTATCLVSRVFEFNRSLERRFCDFGFALNFDLRRIRIEPSPSQRQSNFLCPQRTLNVATCKLRNWS